MHFFRENETKWMAPEVRVVRKQYLLKLKIGFLTIGRSTAYVGGIGEEDSIVGNHRPQTPAVITQHLYDDDIQTSSGTSSPIPGSSTETQQFLSRPMSAPISNLAKTPVSRKRRVGKC